MADHNALDDCERPPVRGDNYGWALVPDGPSLYAPGVIPSLVLSDWLGRFWFVRSLAGLRALWNMEEGK